MKNLFFLCCAIFIGCYIFWPDFDAPRESPRETAQKESEPVDPEIGPAPYFARNPPFQGSGGMLIRQYLEQTLKDPDSLEIIAMDGPFETTFKGERYWRIDVRYRARNGFGGMAVEDGVALIRHHRVIHWLPQ